MTKHYVEFYFPGSFVANVSQVEISDRLQSMDIPDGCYGYRTFDLEVIESNDEVLKGSPKNFSPFTYYGKEYSLEQIKFEFPDLKILHSNIENNGYKKAVLTRRGNWAPLDPNDVVISKPESK